MAIGSSWSVGQDSGVVGLYETASWSFLKHFQGPAGLLREEDDDSCAEMPPRGVDYVSFCRNEQLLATTDSNLRLWNLQTCDFVDHILPLDGRESGDILDVSKDGEYLAFRSKGRMRHGIGVRWRYGR
jgi:hypothetical protein